MSLLTHQLGSQTLCKLLDADHDDTMKYFFDDGQRKEISISAAGYFGEMKKTETPSKRRRVGKYSIAIADRHNARNDFSRRDRLYYQVSTVTVVCTMTNRPTDA